MKNGLVVLLVFVTSGTQSVLATECTSSEFQCENDRCVPKRFRCNGYNNCGDNSDEEECVCTPSEFQCDNDRCVLKRFRCNGYNDCGDNSDEEECVKFRCASSELQCDNDRCVPAWTHCNENDDCGDSSDEKGCVNVGAAVGVPVGIIAICCIIAIPACVAIAVTAKKKKRLVVRTHAVATTRPVARNRAVTTAQTTCAVAPATQRHYPAEFTTGPQEAPPPYPGDGYPVYHPPTPPPTTVFAPPLPGYASPPPDYSETYPQLVQAPYGGQPYPYSQTPAYSPPTDSTNSVP